VERERTDAAVLEALLAESQEQYRRLFQHNPYPTWVFCLDTLRFMDVNDAMVRTYGWSREELLGMSLHDIRPPEDVAKLIEGFEHTRAMPQGTSGPWRHRRKDGTILDVEISFRNLPFGGRTARLVVACDVTERRLAEERRRRLLGKIVSAQEDERSRIARELHDAIGQSLTALTVGLRALEQSSLDPDVRRRGAHLRQIAADTIREVRRLSRGLRPSALDDLGLEAALAQYAAEYAENHGLSVDYRSSGFGGERLRGAVETAVYRIAQEALTNVARHAHARAIEVRLRRAADTIELTVRDDGNGFVSHLDHLGIAGMRERAALLDGTCAIESRPGNGTLVRVVIPLAMAAA
jgi:PAS domain S-box-containing protein